MEMMSELAHKRGRAVVIVTHDSRVLDFADRIVKIEDGAIAGPAPVLRRFRPECSRIIYCKPTVNRA